MSINSVLHTGIQGIHRGIAGAEQAAQGIVQAGQGLSDNDGAVRDVADSMVELMANEQLVKASAAVVNVGSDTLGTLIDIIA